MRLEIGKSKKLGLVLFLLLAILCPPYIRTFYEARNELLKADVFESNNELEKAFKHLRLSLAWNSPFNAYAKRAQSKFENILNKELPPKTRLLLLQEYKRGLRSSRSFINPRDKTKDPLISKINLEIEAINASPVEKIEEVYQPKENYSFQILTQLTFWLWITLVLAFIFKGFNAEGLLSWERGKKYLIGALISFGAWLFALSMA